MVGWELLGEGLQEVPCCFSCVNGTKSSVVAVLTRVCTEQEGGVLLRCLGGVVQHFDIPSYQVVCDIL